MKPLKKYKFLSELLKDFSPEKRFCI